MPRSTTSLATMKNNAAAYARKIAVIFLLALMAVFLTDSFSQTGSSAQAQTQTQTQTQNSQSPVGAPLGNKSASDMWRAVKRGDRGSVSIIDKKSGIMIQSGGQFLRDLRNGPMFSYSAAAIIGIIALLSLFYMLRGRIRIDTGKSDITITRFNSIERFAHWLVASSFIILGLSGLNMIYGKFLLTPLIGKNGYAVIALNGKWLHNFVAFAFILGLVLILIMWIRHNFPNRHDVIWMLKGGGMFTKGTHPPAKKFNAGQKILFWMIILGGASISLSGISLMFPFQLSLFSDTFEIINRLGLNLPTTLTGIEEMQLALVWHSVASVVMICVIIAHIYIGTVGMEGAFDAMGSGEVDINWAKEHHSIWVEELERKEQAKAASRQAAAE